MKAVTMVETPQQNGRLCPISVYLSYLESLRYSGVQVSRMLQVKERPANRKMSHQRRHI